MREEQRLLDEVYEALDYESGDLVDLASYANTISTENYIAKGQWLDTCRAINQRAKFKVDKLFFVQDNPIVVFVDATSVEKERIFSVYNEVWSLARPRLVFIENSISITIYDLASSPAKSNNDLSPLSSVVKESKQILKQLKEYDRARIESGTVFGDKRFSTVSRRADLSLINDLKQARKKLFENGLDGDKLKYAHALIGRSIFIRYLEDRGVLTKEYFLKVAKGNSEWERLIETPLEVNFYRDEMRDLLYPRLLSNKELTYHLFKQIAEDFNGDTFSTDVSEEMVIEQKHLDLLQNFLLGDGNTQQLPLFLWAYRFDVIPIDLISSIYEEFYHSENLIDTKTKKLKDGKGTHYTPSSLVEFLLSRTLTKEVLESKPRVLDPACGSGIFLVESFRRMVRHQIAVRGKNGLTVDELLSILKNQIAGIEINGEAIKIAAFSLYLSLLHYLNPPSILGYIESGKKLPYLIWHGKQKNNHFNILLESNSFNEAQTSKVFESNSFDVIVGNPPWGTPSTKDVKGRLELNVIVDWCSERDITFPDKEPSHAFLFRALEFLKPNGLSSLLVKSGVLLKFSPTSNAFKQQLLETATVTEIINFSHVRRVFFSGAISPFILLKLENRSSAPDDSINYWSLRKSKSIEKNKVVISDKNDFQRIPYSYTNVYDVWKILYWGNQNDFKLIQSIRRFPQLQEFLDMSKTAQGFKEANKSKKAGWLLNFPEMPVEYFEHKYSSFNLISDSDLNKVTSPPPMVEARGGPELYQGLRILIRKGVRQENIYPKGQIISRLEGHNFSFRHSILCLKLIDISPFSYEFLIGVLWSSLFRYYLFITSSRWGIWYEEINKIEVLGFPVPTPNEKNKSRIEVIVRKLLDANEQISNELHNSNPWLSEREIHLSVNSSSKIKTLEFKLDQAVFELYQLTKFEQQLIEDRCRFDIDLFYNKEKGLANHPTDKESLDKYIESFKKQWAKNLDEDEYFTSQIISSQDKSMLGIVFHLHSKQNQELQENQTKQILDDFELLLTSEVSRNIFTDGLLRRVSEETIFIIKRNIKGHWTQTEAFVDAEATLLQVLSN
ncbi:MAG: N-6 DNA methylase [Cyclobacteriaceae bacterium]